MNCKLLIPAISAVGDMDMFRWAGDGVERGETWFDACSPSDWVLALALAAALAPLARASAVALAASSIVPVWWF